MVSVIVKITLLVHFLHVIVNVAGQSPCPNYFRFIRDETTEEISGYVEIPSPPKGVALQLTVSFSIAVALPTKYVGRLELAKSKEESVKAVQRGRSLKYRVFFPLRRPIPFLTGLRFNNQDICSGPRATGPIVTSIVLHHTLYPPGVLQLSDNGNMIPDRPDGNYAPSHTQPHIFETGPPQSPVYQRTTQPPLFQPSTSSGLDNKFDTAVHKYENNENCGLGEKINPLISKGEATSPGQWPWLVAIFIVKFRFEFQCAGTLLTNTHIITAAHCFHVHDIDLPNGSILVSLGRYRLRDWRENGSLNMDVASYKIHPDYNTGGNADSDLAIVVLRERVEYSATIKPICLWSGSTDLDIVVGKTGYVVGWGRDELGNQNVQEPRMSRAPIVSQEVCLWSNKDFVTITSNRTFCAGSRDGSGPCNGDSGSGFVIYKPNTERYYLRGVVSRSLLDRGTQTCDLKEYVVYVDVAKYLDWIREQISA